MSIETLVGIHHAGYPLVFVEADRKRPRGVKWQFQRYSEEQIVRRCERTPDGNWGILLGPDAGVIDVELDGPEGPADLARLFDGVEIPTTPAWQSARGTHRLFAWDDRFTEIGKASIKYGDVEIRLGCGRAAQSLIPPSKTGETIREWIGPPLSADCRPAPLPDIVVDRIIEAAKAKPVEAINLEPILAWLERGGITPTAVRPEADFIVIDLAQCPFKHQGDGHTGLLVFPDGHIAVKCFHAKCCDKTLYDLEQLVGPYDGPRVIVITPDEKRVVDQAIASLTNAENVYQRGGQLVRIVRNAPNPPGINRPDDAPRIVPMALATVRETLASCATWVKMKEAR